MKEIILIGAFHETIELCESCGYRIVGIIENSTRKEYFGYKILGNDKEAELIIKKYNNSEFVITPDKPEIRKKIFDYYNQFNIKFSKIISPHSVISKSATLKSGVTIQRGVNISSFARIENFVRINTFANIMHDVEIGSFCTIAPNAVILGNVSIEENTYIGSNSTILPSLKIGQNVIVGAGAVVTKDVQSNTVVVGNPARKLIK